LIARGVGTEHDVVTARSAVEALGHIHAGQQFDVILCDLMMPLMSGMEFYQRLSVEAPEQALRIVFLSGGAFTQASRSFLDAVPNARLDKPFDIKNLRAMLHDRLR
jgi:two-component system NtrC family sensor kinase